MDFPLPTQLPHARLPSVILNTGHSSSQLERMNIRQVPTDRSECLNVGYVGEPAHSKLHDLMSLIQSRQFRMSDPELTAPFDNRPIG